MQHRQVTRETAVLEGWFRGGKLDGPARRTEMKKFRTFRQQVKKVLGDSTFVLEDPTEYLAGHLGRPVQSWDSLGAMLAMEGGKHLNTKTCKRKTNNNVA